MNTKRIQLNTKRNTKSTQLRTKNVPRGSKKETGSQFVNNTIIIPELEEVAARNDAQVWSDGEKAILSKYYRRVTTTDLIPFLTGKNKDAIHRQAYRQGLTRPRGKT